MATLPAVTNDLVLSGLTQLKGPLVITDEGTGIAEQLAHKLRNQGLDVQVVSSIPEGVGGIIFLGGLSVIGSVAEALEINREAFRAARIFANTKASGNGIFVTVQDTGGDFGLSGKSGQRAWLGGLAGLIKTANLEWADTQVKAIDIERGERSPEAIAELLVEELFHGGCNLEVGIPETGERVILSVTESALGHAERTFADESVFVVSGGARGVTAASLVALAHQVKLRFVLLGRSVIQEEPPYCAGLETESELNGVLLKESKKAGKAWTPAQLTKKVRAILSSRQIKETIQKLEDAGSSVRYVSVDVRNSKKLEKALHHIREEWGPVSGIIHGAGLVLDKRIAQNTDEQFESVFQTKVDGLSALLSATRNDPLRLICLFSSISGRTGNDGQCAYAMANEILNKVASAEAKRRGDDCVVKSFNWGAWNGGGMVTPTIKAHFEQQGISLLPIDEGAEFFAEELLRGSLSDIEVIATRGRADIVSSREWKLDVLVDKATYPFLVDHTFQGDTIIPVVIVLDWFVKVAQCCHPELHLLGFYDLKVLKRIALADWGTKLYRFTIHVKETYSPDTTILHLNLQDGRGVTHYAARAEMALSVTMPRVSVPEFALQSVEDITASDVYRKYMFHGPQFFAISKLYGFSEEGGAAELVGMKQVHWGGDYRSNLMFDPLTFDGALQLAGLWGIRYLGKRSLPLKIGSYIPLGNWKGAAPVSCYVRSKAIDSLKTQSDIYLVTEEGELCAVLYDVELYTFEL